MAVHDVQYVTPVIALGVRTLNELFMQAPLVSVSELPLFFVVGTISIITASTRKKTAGKTKRKLSFFDQLQLDKPI